MDKEVLMYLIHLQNCVALRIHQNNLRHFQRKMCTAKIQSPGPVLLSVKVGGGN